MIGRIPVLDVRPLVDCGRRPAKAVAGETFQVTATVFREGHDAVAANVVLRDPSGRPGPWTPMRELTPGTDRWGADVTPGAEGRWTYAVEGWSDPVATWRHHAQIKIPAGIDTALVLAEGAQLYERAAAGVPKSDGREAVLAAVDALRDETRSAAARLAAALAPDAAAALNRHPLRELVTASRPLPLLVERQRALYGSWYELFPRSEGAVVREGAPPVPGTLRTAAERLPAVAAMGFDVVYLPPVHPIGTTHRKGPDNSLSPGADDVGVPWAIGSPDGGHDALHPGLGTMEDFDHFVETAGALRMEVALDFALQCSPDHPWVTEHPEWFHHRADGSIAYAENPPKKYQDIYPIAFEADMRGLVRETLRVLRFWMDHGVRIFRVDNPHTKPVVFWEKVIADINRSHPDVVFLAEAFTRPAMMHTLAAIGFQQSYTYFTWRNTKQELTEYLTELSGEAASYMRPNFFVNTPDILHAYLQRGGRPAFEVRAVLAATMAPSWGVYAGYELCENTPLRDGSEEYLHSEKYQLRPRDWESAEREGRTIAPLITTLNRIRRRNPALQQLRDIHFHPTDNDAVIAYSKSADGASGSNTVVVVANLDPHHTQEATVSLDMPHLGLEWHESAPVRDELTGETYHWGRANYVRLEPGITPAHIVVLRPSPPIGGSPTS
ncbi:alpha-1,4-glucan--maltose-1-phosphate maltosyltransferase [Streptomyces lunaelactis]|uniref:Alpha-1,4-glucan:maltose-1-phosphate maltosyltransferase n=2 Tax=Streptomyces lunaelactis TaxID=1535768 RepID=A0A2R4T8I7_9ACTN|nr:alpha-1,4-glucan--maltose-1-phosphate maltosyltransferase [Streptomyces lunaelactis]AVZ75391.1 alpha-1,4-glucan--maltose-1-phosphate maltosyltransferase [Streptomyces lunaelactis]NUK15832.1 alpha-1,4-glucan--maltose-1-phosphate maltosyltransferase [Streptomyces lunaelactis]NUK33861.1 alpha-1,4-glucan--maltose-1-phosphate maltosyltransferase [Streptomyces lunaelactis]NUK42331.1 alpha-1,4-glucan--maltose-1-phosphate maltosyltransferase [Streptomyces lunaelactis]NUK71925.1 alpha-1,4-glucan--ma